MKATTDYTDEEYINMQHKRTALYGAIAGHQYSELFTYQRRVNDSRYSFGGRYTDKLVELLGRHPDEEEIIMLIDCGYSHCGAFCTIDRVNKIFGGHVNTN